MPTYLSPHFTLEELIKSDIALRHNIDNTPTSEVVDCLAATANAILEPVRRHFSVAFAPTSGFRCPLLNALVKGSASSQHTVGQAVDFEVPGHTNYEVAAWINVNLDYDQLILEFYRPGMPDSGWVHCSFKGKDTNRLQALTFDGHQFHNSLIA